MEDRWDQEGVPDAQEEDPNRHRENDGLCTPIVQESLIDPVENGLQPQGHVLNRFTDDHGRARRPTGIIGLVSS
jgi:hypothetical protein